MQRHELMKFLISPRPPTTTTVLVPDQHELQPNPIPAVPITVVRPAIFESRLGRLHLSGAPWASLNLPPTVFQYEIGDHRKRKEGGAQRFANPHQILSRPGVLLCSKRKASPVARSSDAMAVPCANFCCKTANMAPQLLL